MSELDPRLANLSPAQRRLLEIRLQQKGQARPPAEIPPCSDLDAAPLSFAQRGLWFLQQLEPDGAAFVVTSLRRLTGPLDADALRRATAALIARHQILRTTYHSGAAEPYGRVRPTVDDTADDTLAVIDLGGLTPAEKDTIWEEPLSAPAVQEMVERPFDLTTDPVLQFHLLQLSTERGLLLVRAHHIASDRWSAGLVNRDLARLYAAYRRGESPNLPPLPIQFADFAAWQRTRLQGTEAARLLDYWRMHLDGAPPALEVAPRRRHRAHGAPAVHLRQTLSPALLDRARTVARQAQVTPFMLFFALFNVLLHRYSGADDLVVGTPVAGRTHPATQELVGLFINSLALRTRFAGAPTFATLLQQVRRTVLDGLAHQDLPFDRLVEALQPSRTPDQAPIFQVMFDYLNVPSHSLTLEGVTVEEVGALPAPPAYTLSLMAHETPHGLHLQWEADAALLDQEDLDQTARSYALLLEQVLTDPKQSVDTLALLSPQEQTQLLAASRGTVRPLAAETVVSAIETAVDRTPQAPAVIAQGEHLSYAALEEKANRLAHHLRALGMGAGRVVGLLPERNARLVVAILGILKAGAAYLPLDPTQPPERLRFMLEESCASAVVMAASLAGSLDLPAGCRPVLLENPALTEQPGHRPNAAAGPADPMYVVYTSGSTGAPKGVVISHGAAQNFVDWARRVYDLTPTDRVLQFASIGFDTAVEEIFPTLAAGATLLINPDRWRGGIADFLHWPARHGVTVLDLPTALWHTWVTAPDQAQPHLPASVRLVIVGGEEARAADYAAWRRRIGPDVRWINTYGPSEATVVALAFEPPPTWDAVRQGMPIGRPLDNVYAYVLDAQGRLAPPGAAGELYLGGAGLADGYLHSPELTAERFIAPPWSDTENAPARLYRTGDRVRRRADGLLEFLGRVDDQVKLRGYRVEPDEIAAVLRRHAAVQDAAVQVYGLNDRTSTDQDEPAPEPRLVAYVVPCAGVELSTAALRDHCTASLPDYMTPTTFITLPALPLSPGGKVDRRRLPMPDSTRAGAEEAGAPPASPLETLLAGIWCELLDLPAVGRDDNFFTLGGHSLLTIRLAARVVDLLKVDLPLRRYFEAPTVARQAACLRRDPTMGARVDRLAELVLQLADLSDEEVVQRLAARRAAAQPAGQEP